ncbi:RxLR effector protein [Phytophthora megakarya]|uniref:RxLR effector protein n=1 Tax=Phytophthora megakarya TaxID=4795 RepID=A0A225UWQ5_9STRA|nr:RxLR effector protein [Phytophthora megakarya]
MCQRFFLKLLLLVNFAALLHGLTNNKEASQPHRDIRDSVAKTQNTIDAASEERFHLKNLLRGFKKNPKAAKVFQSNPSFAKTLNKDPQLTMKVLRDPEVSKLGAALKKNLLHW